jgi:hypothetical protein
MLLLSASVCFPQPDGGNSDSVLYCYWLNAHYDTIPDIDDGRLAACWDMWGGRDSAVVMSQDGLDQRLVVKAVAYGKGLCLLFELSDDYVLRDTSELRWSTDAIAFLFDTMSSERILSCDTSCFCHSPYPSLTKSGRLFALVSDTNTGNECLRAQYYDQDLLSWGSVHIGSDIGKVIFHLYWETLRQNNKTYIEWLFTWEYHIVEPTVPYMPVDVPYNWLANRHLAFAFGYSDRDLPSGSADSVWWPTEGPLRSPAALGDIVVVEWESAVGPRRIRNTAVTTDELGSFRPVTVIGRSLKVPGKSSLPVVLPRRILLPKQFWP